MRASFFFFATIICLPVFSQNYNMTLLDTVEFPGQHLANIWGYTDGGGDEYALAGTADGMYIIDVTTPTAPARIQQLTDGISSQWREIKTYQDYAYITSEGLDDNDEGGLGIADLSNLPNTPVPFHKYYGDGTINDDLHRAHALDVDEAQGYAYIYGTTGLASGGAVCLNLNNDPYNPTYAGQYNTNYIHDGYSHNNTVYGSHIWVGYFSIIDFSNKSAPVVEATHTTPNAFTHNTWLTDDGNYILTTDEKGSSFLAMYDISNPNSIVETDRIQTTPSSGSVVHNTYVIGDHAVTSWYRDGVTITDISRPGNIVQVARYDTYSWSSGYGFEGCWGVYPYFPSGNIIASNRSQPVVNNGLGGQGGVMYILSSTYPDACFVEGTVTDQSNGANLFGVSVEIQHTDPLNSTVTGTDGKYATGQPTSGTYDVKFTKSGYVTQTISVNFTSGGLSNVNVQMLSSSLPLELISFSGKVEETANRLVWTTAHEQRTASHEIQRKGNPDERWEALGQLPAAGNSDQEMEYEFLDGNPYLSTQYRILTLDLDGKEHYSETILVERPGAGFFIEKIYPIPNHGHLELAIVSEKERCTTLMVGDLSGKVLLEQKETFKAGQNLFQMELPGHWPNGQYWLRLDGGDSVVQETFLLER